MVVRALDAEALVGDTGPHECVGPRDGALARGRADPADDGRDRDGAAVRGPGAAGGKPAAAVRARRPHTSASGGDLVERFAALRVHHGPAADRRVQRHGHVHDDTADVDAQPLSYETSNRRNPTLAALSSARTT